MSRLRDHVKKIPERKKKLYRSLTDITMNVSKRLDESDMNKEEFAEKLDCSVEHIDQFFAGGINLSLRTIFEIEEILDIELIDTKEYTGA